MLNAIAWTMVDDSEPIKGMDYQVAEALAAQAVGLLPEGTGEYAETLDTLALARIQEWKNWRRDWNREKRRSSSFGQVKDAHDAETLKAMQGSSQKI